MWARNTWRHAVSISVKCQFHINRDVQTVPHAESDLRFLIGVAHVCCPLSRFPVLNLRNTVVLSFLALTACKSERLNQAATKRLTDSVVASRYLKTASDTARYNAVQTVLNSVRIDTLFFKAEAEHIAGISTLPNYLTVVPVSVIIFRDRFFIGESVSFSASADNLSPRFDHEVSSLMVVQPVWVTFFAGPRYTGDKMHVLGPYGVSSLEDLHKGFPSGNWENEIRSAFVHPAGVKPETGGDMVCRAAPGVTCGVDDRPPAPAPPPKPPAPPGPPANTQRICLGSSKPTGWLITRREKDLDCDNYMGIVYETFYIERYSDKPVGASMAICYGQTIPSGWSVTSTEELGACPREPTDITTGPEVYHIRRNK
jgi:hypothetical protein